MSGLTGFKVYLADFFNDNGDFIGSKKIGSTFTSKPSFHFPYKDGVYLFDSSVSLKKHCPFPYLFDYYSCSYNYNNPTPLKLSFPVSSGFNASVFNVILKNDVLQKLNNVRKSGFSGLFTFRNLIIFSIVAFAIYFFVSSGGDVSSVAERATSAITSPRG